MRELIAGVAWETSEDKADEPVERDDDNETDPEYGRGPAGHRARHLAGFRRGRRRRDTTNAGRGAAIVLRGRRQNHRQLADVRSGRGCRRRFTRRTRRARIRFYRDQGMALGPGGGNRADETLRRAL